jgi:glycosyltransferase involved in cell wall biosynthesis
MNTNQSCSVVIPVYNSQESLPLLIKQLLSILPTITSQYEIILVNDGSQDQSWEVIEEFSKENEFICGIDLSKNFGQHNALLCGIRQAQYETIVTMDDDLQHPPSEIPKLLNLLNDGFDIVYGTPKQERHNLWRNVSSKIAKWSLNVSTNKKYAGKISAFRAFNTKLRGAFKSYSNSYVSIDVLLSWGAQDICFVEVNHKQRQIGQSQYTFYKLLRHAINMVLGFSVIPLRIASILGFIFTIFGFVILLYVFVRYLIEGGSVPGFPFLASMVAIFSGFQMFILGIVGEYLARLFTNIMTKPPYMISQIT